MAEDVQLESTNEHRWKKISILMGASGALLGALGVASSGYFEQNVSIRAKQIELIESAVVFGDRQKTAENLRLLIDLGLVDLRPAGTSDNLLRFLEQNGIAIASDAEERQPADSQ